MLWQDMTAQKFLLQNAFLENLYRIFPNYSIYNSGLIMVTKTENFCNTHVANIGHNNSFFGRNKAHAESH